MDEIESFVKSVLGEDSRRFDFALGNIAWHGWRKLLQQDLDSGSTALALVRQNWRAFHDQDIRMFVGSSAFPPDAQHIFAIPNLPVLDIIEFCETGSHNAIDASFDPVDSAWGSVMAKVARLEPEAGRFRMWWD